jgi:hypothetical protein
MSFGLLMKRRTLVVSFCSRRNLYTRAKRYDVDKSIWEDPSSIIPKCRLRAVQMLQLVFNVDKISQEFKSACSCG